MTDRTTLAWIFAIGVFLWLAWVEIGPLLMERIKPKSQRPFRGGFPARLKLIADEGTHGPRQVEAFNVISWFVSGPAKDRYIFLVFEKDVGLHNVSLTNNDGRPARYEVHHAKPRAVVIRLITPFTLTGITIECRNEPDFVPHTNEALRLTAEEQRVAENRDTLIAALKGKSND